MGALFGAPFSFCEMMKCPYCNQCLPRHIVLSHGARCWTSPCNEINRCGVLIRLSQPSDAIDHRLRLRRLGHRASDRHITLLGMDFLLGLAQFGCGNHAMADDARRHLCAVHLHRTLSDRQPETKADRGIVESALERLEHTFQPLTASYRTSSGYRWRAIFNRVAQGFSGVCKAFAHSRLIL